MIILLIKSYGFKNFIDIDDYIDTHKYLFPYRYRGTEPEIKNEEPIKAIFVIRCPLDWQSSIQCCIDLLQSDGILGNISNDQKVEIYFSNPDL